MSDRLLNPVQRTEDLENENILRPKTLSDFVGQAELRENLGIFLQAARERGEPLDHVLFAGPPGLGKTTLASIIASEMGSKMKVTSGPVLDRPSDLAGMLTNLNEGDVLFIDEIHRLNRTVEEYLYPAMEDFAIDILLESGPSARSVHLPLPRFTLVGATTRTGMLTGPLRDRFGLTFRMDPYRAEEIEIIGQRTAGILGFSLDAEASTLLGRRCRGTPRVVNRVVRRCRDVAQVLRKEAIDRMVAEKTLSILGLDELGLDEMDRRILTTLIDRFEGGPLGLSTLSAALNEDQETIEEVYEPYLIQLGLLARTPRGRVATPAAARHLGLSVHPRSSQEMLQL
ncbi:MAG: Holliday junction branch migration DNA helicase RuvB [Fibrobacterota bacterium]|nr:Holliday junction branch migration DNA helicase RuvB [Fibrobacterota bacterium]QQS04855.1 MAG: Holliday junction branch migration DNA helicase RuvB [Fibrobacterota bacterium]